MKTTNRISRARVLHTAALVALLCATHPVAWAAPIPKANNSSDLDQGGSWVGGTAPAVGDTAVWDSTVVSASSAAVGVSFFLFWDAIQVVNPANDFTINSTTPGDGIYLNLAGTAIDLSAATRNLTLNCGVFPQAAQTWNVGAGRTLTLGGDVQFGGFEIKKAGAGILSWAGTNSNPSALLTLLDGTTLVSGGNDRLPTGAHVQVGTATLDLGGNSQTLGRLRFANSFSANTSLAVATNGNLRVDNAVITSGNDNDFAAGPGSVFDMTGLDSFTFDATNRQIRVLPWGQAANNITNTVLLARSGGSGGVNTIKASQFIVGGASGSSANNNHMGILEFGTVNTVNAGTFRVGGFNGRGTAGFAAGLTSPSLTLRGPAGGSERLPTFTIGETSSGSRSGEGTLNLAGGTVDALVNEMWIGRMIAGASVNDTSTLNLTGGSLDATALVLAYKRNNGTPIITSTLNQFGGTVQAATLIMGTNDLSVSPGTPIVRPTYHLAGGTLRAANIVSGEGQVNAGSTRVLNWAGGTIQNYDASTDLLVANGAALADPGLVIVATNGGSRAFNVDSGRTVTVAVPVNQGSITATRIAKNGAGTLVLQGTNDNAFTGLELNAGTVQLAKDSSGSVHALGNDSVIHGGLLILSGGGGDQISNARSLSLNGGTFDLHGNTETIAGLAGTGGTVTDSLTGGTLTVNPALNSNYVAAASLSGTFNLTKDGLGKQTLTGSDSRSGGANVINDGVLEIGNGGVTGSLNGDVTINGGTLAFNRSGTLNYAGNLSGPGNVAQNGPGTLILSGSDTHTGSTLVNSGTLSLPAAATSIGGSVVHVASGAVLDVTPAGGGFFISSQVLQGAGTVLGPVFVGSGSRVAGTLTTAGLTLGDSATNAPGGDLLAGTLSASSVTFNFGSVLSVDLASVTTVGAGVNDLLTISGNLDLSSPCSLKVQQLAGALANGTYVLATFSSFTGSPANMTVPTSLRYTYTLSTNATQLLLTVSGAPANLVWRGDGLLNAWDDGLTANWFNTGSSLIEPFFSGDSATLDNTGSNNVPVALNAQVFPSAVNVTASHDYTISGAGSLSGAMALNKSGAGTLTLDVAASDFSGAVNLNGGTVVVGSVAPNGSPSPLGSGTTLAFNGGALEYTGADVPASGFSRLISVGAGGGTLVQNGSGNYMFLTNTVSGSGTLTKTGPKQLIVGQLAGGVPLAGDNTYDGDTVIAEGNLQIRHPNALGSTVGKTVVTNTGSLAVGGGWVATIAENLEISGDGGGSGGLQVNDGGTEATFTGAVVLNATAAVGGSSPSFFPTPIGGAGALNKVGGGTATLLSSANTYAGGTVISGGVLSLGTNGTSGWLAPQPIGTKITNNGTLRFLRSDVATLSDGITGAGLLQQNGDGVTILAGASDFTGPVAVNNGQLRVAHNNALGASTNATTVAGGQNLTARVEFTGGVTVPELFVLGQKAGTNNLNGAQPAHLLNVTNDNTVTGHIQLTGGGNCWGIASESGLLTLTTLTNDAGGFTRPIYLEGDGDGEIVTALDDLTDAWLQVRKHGAGTWTLDGFIDLPKGFGAFEGSLVIAATADYQFGLEPVSVREVGTLVINDVDFPMGVNVSGSGTLAGNGIINGSVAASENGTVSPGTSIGTLTFNAGLTLTGGAKLLLELDTADPATNDVVGGFITPGGTLEVVNAGPALQVGDKFQLFSFAPFGDFAVTNLPAGYDWINNIGADGTIEVAAVLTPPIPTTPTNISFVATSTNVTITWPANYIGWSLQAQTNLLSVGLRPASNFWTTIPGTELTNTVTFPTAKTNPTVFYRLFYAVP